MTVKECEERISDLKELVALYYRLYYDGKSCMYKCSSLKLLAKKATDELLRLSELLYSDELENSYDQNTGRINEH